MIQRSLFSPTVKEMVWGGGSVTRQCGEQVVFCAEAEDWDSWVPDNEGQDGGEDGGQHCEDPDFNVRDSEGEEGGGGG